MAIVLNFSDKKIWCSEVRFSKKKWYLKNSDEVTGYTLSVKELLSDFIFLKNFLVENFGKKKNEKFYVTINGFDIVYRTTNYTDYVIEEEANDLSDEEKESALLDLCKKNIPEGSQELHKNYEVCILSAAKIESLGRYVICTSYIPSQFFENIRLAFEDAGLSLYGIYPEVYGLYNALQQIHENVYLKFENIDMMANAACLLIWPHSDNYQFEDVKEFLSTEMNELVPNFAEGEYLGELDNLVKNTIDIENYNVNEANMAALGILNKSNGLYIVKAKNNEEENGENVETNKLRKFLQEIRDRIS